jgi:two-component system, NarL family, nitrate/nitrite response regulator NarL
VQRFPIPLNPRNNEWMAKKAKRISVLIADDHSLFAQALQAILSTDQRFETVGLAKDGRQAVELAASLEPDVVLMDISMPVLDGFAATKEITKRVPETAVLMLTGSNARADVNKARSSGAAGYITKDRIAGDLIGAILEVMSR